MYRTCSDVNGYDVVILCGGTNDYGNNTTEATFRTAFQHVLDTLTANNTKVIVATPVTRTNRTAQNSAGLYLSDYCTMEKELAEAMNLQVIDLNTLTNTDTFKATLNDGLHPNEMGQRIIADLILANA
jgi:lysophospholipase L1-like esterase